MWCNFVVQRYVMLKFISWKEYWLFILIAVILYYVVIVLLYCREDVVRIIRNDKVEPDDQLSNDELLLQDLQKLHTSNVKKKIPIEELFLHIRRAVQQYQPDDEVKVNEFINSHFPELEEKDIRRIWQ